MFSFIFGFRTWDGDWASFRVKKKECYLYKLGIFAGNLKYYLCVCVHVCLWNLLTV